MSQEEAQAQEASCSSSSSSSSGVPHASHPECYVIVYNISKHSNVGTLLRSCTAFGVKAACLVGSRQFNAFGSHGACEHMQLVHFPTLEACCTYLKESAGCRVLGVEITPEALPVQSQPFSGNTAFMLGNEGQGLSEKQMRLCDGFVYIPQHGGGTASLNVTVAASIILHTFAVWARYPERQREGAKFVVDPRPRRTTPRGFVGPTPQEAEAAALLQARGGGGGGGQDNTATATAGNVCVTQQGAVGAGLEGGAAAAGGGGEAWLEAAMQQHGGADGLLDAVAGCSLTATS